MGIISGNISLGKPHIGATGGGGGAVASPILSSISSSGEGSDRQVSNDFNTAQWRAFSFTPTAGTLTGVGLKMYQVVGALTGDVIIRIETDNAGDPSGTLVHANATMNVTVDAFGTSPPASLRVHNFASSFAVSAVSQWLVYKPAFTSSASETLVVAGQAAPAIAGMVIKRTLDSGANWAVLTEGYNYEIYGSGAVIASALDVSNLGGFGF